MARPEQLKSAAAIIVALDRARQVDGEDFYGDIARELGISRKAAKLGFLALAVKEDEA